MMGELTKDFLGESEGSLPPPHDSFPDASEAMNDFWSMSGNFIYRHHVEPRVKLYSPREESFPIPLKYIDVTRTTHTNLDVMRESLIDDYWNIDGSRELSDPWTGFTQFTLLEEKPPDGFMWSGVRLTRKQLASRPDHLWPELWKSMGKHAKLKEKQMWSNEKVHLENARKLWGIYFIDPEDKEFKETIKNARKKLETSVAPAMPCKIMKNCGSGGSDKNKTKLACILEEAPNGPESVTNAWLHHTSDFKQYCHVGNTAQQWRLRLFQDSYFAGDPEDSKSTSDGILCIFGSHTFVPVSWMRRHKLQFRTVRRSLKLFLLMHVYAWTEFLLFLSGTWLWKCCILPPSKQRHPKSKRGETCSVTNHQENKPSSDSN